MRVIALAMLLLPLAACAGGPRALGIIGPRGTAPAPVAGPAPSSDPFDNPDTLRSGTRYGPSYTPSTDGGHFWGYN
ncbi:MAG TPA: hypothetical protein VND19_13345 [Acetobacteraceae bacterium]|nr:hypothetical protein [Acetobacteraceae bacterium]